MKNEQLFSQIKETIEQKHMLNHPFYQCWTMGKLSKAELVDYLKQYFYLEASFPRFMSALHSKTEDAEMRKVMLENLMEEEAGQNNHVAQLLRLCEQGFGFTKEEIAAIEPNQQTKALIAAFEQATNAEEIKQGLAAMVVYKQQVSDVAATKIDGLKEHYGITDENALQFYATHAEVNTSYHALLDQVVDQTNDEQVMEEVVTIRDAFWGFLDGVTTPEIIARCA